MIDYVTSASDADFGASTIELLSPVEAALRFPLVHPAVVSVIPGASRPEEVALNMQTLAADIPSALWAELKAKGFIRAEAPVPHGLERGGK